MINGFFDIMLDEMEILICKWGFIEYPIISIAIIF